MVGALAASKLRVIMDVVYNHTNASGQNDKSVLDKVVPGYYHRLNAKGQVETSTCCQNTASEHAMMEKLLIDSVVLWAKAYKVDGFRFDLMGHHMVSNITNLRARLDALTVEKDGVDGKAIYLYGEGWNFGEVQDNARGKNAIQVNMAGTGIGTFSDRLRDAARGGGPFSGVQEQGFATGLLSFPNATDQGDAQAQKSKLLLYADQIKVGLAGNLKDYTLTDRTGAQVTGEVVRYNGQPTGYTGAPQENIAYVSAHDNETFWDAIQLKAPASATVADRVRMNNLGLSLVMLGQGVPFFHAGDDLLRSKSLDRNSYNSGDWFNTVDWTYQSNNWGVGLPMQGDNAEKWPLLKPLLADPKLKATSADIQGAVANFQALLRVRKSSRLFRLRTADQIKQHVSFLNSGPDQVPGLIVMLLSDDKAQLDATASRILVVFNATNQTQTVSDATLSGAWALHPDLASAKDAALAGATFVDGAFKVPALTTAVFVAAAAQPAATAQPTAAAAPSAAATVAAPTAAAPSVAAATAAPPTAAATVTAPTPAPSSGNGSSTAVWISVAVAVGSALFGGAAMRRRRRP